MLKERNSILETGNLGETGNSKLGENYEQEYEKH